MVWSMFALSVFAALSHLSQGEEASWKTDNRKKTAAAEGAFEGVKTRFNQIDRRGKPHWAKRRNMLISADP